MAGLPPPGVPVAGPVATAEPATIARADTTVASR